MQLGNRQGTVALSSVSSTALGSFGSLFVFPAVLLAPQVDGKMLSVNPKKVDKWKNTDETHNLIKQMHKKYKHKPINRDLSELVDKNLIDSKLIWTNPWSL